MAALHPYTTRIRKGARPPSYTTLWGTTLADYPDLAAIWSQAGPNLTISPAARWHDVTAAQGIQAGQELVFIGIKLDAALIQEAFRQALLTDDELRALLAELESRRG